MTNVHLNSAKKNNLTNIPGGGGGGGVSRVEFCWVCAVGLSEPLPHYSLFCGQL